MHPAGRKQKAIELRSAGRTHREIASELGISHSTAHLWTEFVRLTEEQKRAIEKRRNRHQMTEAEKRAVRDRLSRYTTTYSKEEWLQKIKDFQEKHGRIPLKRELNAWHSFKAHFGSWNAAIALAGFETNPELFTRKFKAKDGHICDSFSEKIIDDWLHVRNIPHERNAKYIGTRLTADFKIGTKIYVEFFGLAGTQTYYDRTIRKKRRLAKDAGLQLIELYPRDVYPPEGMESKLASVFLQKID
jgi:hypothetical protein